MHPVRLFKLNPFGVFIDRKPPTNNREPLTADRRPPTADRRLISLLHNLPLEILATCRKRNEIDARGKG